MPALWTAAHAHQPWSVVIKRSRACRLRGHVGYGEDAKSTVFLLLGDSPGSVTSPAIGGAVTWSCGALGSPSGASAAGPHRSDRVRHRPWRNRSNQMRHQAADATADDLLQGLHHTPVSCRQRP
jgi:hypothetical protein